LVLSRHRDETIMIGDDIELTVVDIRGDKVRLGINAPSHIAVHRKEIYDAIKRENEQAARLGKGEVRSPPPTIKFPKDRPPGLTGARCALPPRRQGER
jgi:carbon storage regulator